MAMVNTNTKATLAVFLQNSGIGVLFVFLPILSSTYSGILVVGLTVASFFLAEFISSIYFGRVSDKKRNRLLFIRIGFAACAVTFGLTYFVDNEIYLMVAMIGTGISAGIMNSPILAYVYEAQLENKRRAARVISFHTLGWFAGIMAGGIITTLRENQNELFIVIALMFSAGFAVSMNMKYLKVHVQESISTLQVFRRNKWIYLALLLRHTGATAVLTILPLLLLKLAHDADFVGSQGTFLVSVVYGANMITATVFMGLMASRIKTNNIRAFKIGIGCSVIGFSGMFFINDWWQIIPFMFVVGVAWAYMYIGGSLYLMGNNPKSTSMGIFNSVLAFAKVVGPISAGVIAFAVQEYKINLSEIINPAVSSGDVAVTIFAVLIMGCAIVLSWKIHKVGSHGVVKKESTK